MIFVQISDPNISTTVRGAALLLRPKGPDGQIQFLLKIECYRWDRDVGAIYLATQNSYKFVAIFCCHPSLPRFVQENLSTEFVE